MTDVLSAVTLEEANEYLQKESERFGDTFEELPKESWVSRWKSMDGNKAFKVFRNKEFLVQLFRESHGVVRITVNRTRLKAMGRWEDGITWDELQEIKTSMGYGHRDAVEVFPRSEDVVNVANMRHLWCLPEGMNLTFIWRKK